MTKKLNTKALIAAAALLTAAQDTFKVGDVVVWKDAGFATKSFPAPGEPAVVTQVHAVPFRAMNDQVSGTPYFAEPLDIALAGFDRDGNGDLLEFQHDSRRFRLATQEEIDAWDNKPADAE